MHSLEVKTRTSTEEIKSLRLITATKTPYLTNGRLDLEAYDSLIRTQIANGVEGVVVGGTTGEGHLMSKDERVTLIAHTVASFGDSLKVIGNAGSNSTSEAILASEQGFAVGMDAALHVNPYYGKTSTLGLKFHFESVLCVGPTIIYNVPSRTGQDIPPRLICSMAGNFNAIGVKECAESTTDDRIGEYGAHGLAVWSGNDDRCQNARWERGASGVVSVASNIVPGLMRELMFEGQNASLSAKMMPLFRWLFSEPNPIGINTALAQLGIVRPVFRLPYAPLPIEKRADFVTLVEALGRESFVGVKDVRVLQDDDFILLRRY